MTCYVAPVVEGQTEQYGAVERLLQGVWGKLLGRAERLQVLPASRDGRSSLTHPTRPTLPLKAEEARRRLAAAQKRDPAGQGLVLILLDAEGECPKALGPRLLAVATGALPPGTPVSCVLARRMFENWIVAGCSTLGGVNDLPAGLAPPPEPEGCHGANWLEAQLRSVKKNRKYDKKTDGRELVLRMNYPECRAKSPSFDKLCRELEAHFPPPPPPPPPDPTEGEAPAG